MKLVKLIIHREYKNKIIVMESLDSIVIQTSNKIESKNQQNGAVFQTITRIA